MLYGFLLFLHIVFSFLLVGVVLIQSGKGGGLAGLGGGASQAVFGGRGAGDLLTKLTQGLAVGFMASAFVLALLGDSGGALRDSVITTRSSVSVPATEALQSLSSEEDASAEEIPFELPPAATEDE